MPFKIGMYSYHYINAHLSNLAVQFQIKDNYKLLITLYLIGRLITYHTYTRLHIYFIKLNIPLQRQRHERQREVRHRLCQPQVHARDPR